MTVCSQWASVIADDPHRPCHVKSSKSVCSYQTGGSQQTQQQKLPSIPPSWLEDACRAPCSQILPHLALGLGEGRGLTYGLLCFVGYSFQLLRLHSSPSVSVEENAFPPKQLLSAFYAKTSSRAAWNPTVAVCPHNLRCCLCCSSHMFYFYKWLTQLLKNDNYLFYNVCFGGQYAVGIIWSAIACQQKGQSQFGDAKRTNNIPGTGCSCFSSGVIWGWTERVPNILWEQGERVGRLWPAPSSSPFNPLGRQHLRGQAGSCVEQLGLCTAESLRGASPTCELSDTGAHWPKQQRTPLRDVTEPVWKWHVLKPSHTVFSLSFHCTTLQDEFVDKCIGAIKKNHTHAKTT